MRPYSMLIAGALAISGVGLAHADPVADDGHRDHAKHHHARHHHHRHADHTAALQNLTRPPSPPVTARTQAPIPDETVTAPASSSNPSPSVEPAVIQIHYPPMGDGYPLGSSPQAMDDREAAKVTGLEVKLPLGQ